MTLKQRLAILGVAIFFGLIIGVAGGLDYQDEQDQIEEYKMMVCAGYWPDYRQTKPECPNE